MRVNIITPLKMQWIEGYKEVFKDHDVEVMERHHRSADVSIFMWCDEATVKFINRHEKKEKYIVFIRRYEFFTPAVDMMDWSKVDEVILVNDYLAKEFELRTGVKPRVIYNGIWDMSKWNYRERTHGKKIAMVGFVNQKKNYPLAMQIIASLPDDYELHLAGGIQCAATMEYIDNLAKALKKRVIQSGTIDDIDFWLEDKDYLLSTAISEGCPNNVIEAMAKGIKPIVHNWPGALEQYGGFEFKSFFPHIVFNTVEEAVGMITQGRYLSDEYRFMVQQRFGSHNYMEVKQLAEDLCEKSLSGSEKQEAHSLTY